MLRAGALTNGEAKTNQENVKEDNNFIFLDLNFFQSDMVSLYQSQIALPVDLVITKTKI